MSLHNLRWSIIISFTGCLAFAVQNYVLSNEFCVSANQFSALWTTCISFCYKFAVQLLYVLCTWIHTFHLFPTVKQRTCIHDLQHYSRNSYRHAVFSETSGSRLGDPWQMALQTTIEPTLFVDFCVIPLSNTCSFVWPARNVNREIFIRCQEGFCVGTCKFGRVVDQAVLDNRPLRKHFRRSSLHYKRQALLKI